MIEIIWRFRHNLGIVKGSLLFATAILLVGGALYIFESSFPFSAVKHSRDNIIFLTVDTLRADHTPFGNYQRQTMPATAAFFKDGCLFKRAETPRTYTVPAYASMMTGLYPYHTGVHTIANGLPEELETIAESLKKQGYTTAAFVSSFVMTGKYSRLRQGFDLYDDNNEFRTTGQSEFSSQRAAPNTIARVLEFLRKQPRNKPFFLFVHFIDPHGPYTPKGAFKTAFQSGRMETLPVEKIPKQQYLPGITNRFQYIDWYDGEILQLDSELKKLYAELQEFRANSWFLFTADHGEALGEHELYFKHGYSCYESESRVPMVWIPPRSRHKEFPARVINQTVSLVDVYPTVLDALGFPANISVDGESLVPFMKGKPGKNNVRFIERSGDFSPRRSEYAMVDSRFKMLIQNRDGHITHAMYDLSKDPQEQHNLIEDAGSVPEDLNLTFQAYLQRVRTYRMPFVVPDFPEVARHHGRIQAVAKHMNETESTEESEKLRALGYIE